MLETVLGAGRQGGRAPCGAHLNAAPVPRTSFTPLPCIGDTEQETPSGALAPLPSIGPALPVSQDTESLLLSARRMWWGPLRVEGSGSRGEDELIHAIIQSTE